MDMEINESVAANVKEPGATTAPAGTLFDIVKKLPDDSEVEIVLDDSGNQMSVKAGRSNFKLSCLPVADFPELNQGDMPASFSLPANDLRALIDRTKFAMSTEETRYYLNGIYIHAADKDGVGGVFEDGELGIGVDVAFAQHGTVTGQLAGAVRAHTAQVAISQ